MIFLKEQFVALLFSLLCLVVSLLAGMLSGTALYALCIRTAIVALLGYVVGLICGIVIKSLFLETLMAAQPQSKVQKTEPVATAQKAQKKE